MKVRFNRFCAEISDTIGMLILDNFFKEMFKFY